MPSEKVDSFNGEKGSQEFVKDDDNAETSDEKSPS